MEIRIGQMAQSVIQLVINVLFECVKRSYYFVERKRFQKRELHFPTPNICKFEYLLYGLI